MTKQYDPTNRYWWETEGSNTKIGFAANLLEKLGECFHIVPSRRRSKVREKGPLMAVETAGELFSIPSPVAGFISFFDERAMNFPDQIKEEDVVCIIANEEAKPEALRAVPAQPVRVENGELFRQLEALRRWEQVPRAIPPAAPRFYDGGLAPDMWRDEAEQ